MLVDVSVGLVSLGGVFFSNGLSEVDVGNEVLGFVVLGGSCEGSGVHGFEVSLDCSNLPPLPV